MTTANDLEWAMLELVNAERAAEGLDALQMEQQLNTAAEDHSDWMLDVDTFSHTGIDNSSAGDRIQIAGFDLSGSWAWGENIAYSTFNDDGSYLDEVEYLHEALMNSSGHRANILSDDFVYAGIGIEIGEYNGYDVVMITQNFGATDADVQLDSQDGGDASDSEAPLDPSNNTAPQLATSDVTLSKERDDRYATVSELIEVSDADGDDILYYELRDTEGRDNFMLADGTKLDATNGYQLDADQLDDLLVRFNAVGTVTDVEIRAYDGSDYSDWAAISITTVDAIVADQNDAGDTDTGDTGTGDNQAPELVTSDVTLSKARDSRYVEVTDLIDVSDADGDEILSFELRDTEGRDNFMLSDGTKLDASDGYVLEAEQLSDLLLRFNTVGTETDVEIRAYDGAEYSDWETITITTVADIDLVA